MPFARIQKLIGEHLECLNREYALFLNTKPGYVTLAREFENSTRIECSTMAGRGGVKGLKFSFVQELVCELHTKLKYRGMDVKHQNRIYFQTPVENIAKDKVLVGYIGKHL